MPKKIRLISLLTYSMVFVCLVLSTFKVATAASSWSYTDSFISQGGSIGVVFSNSHYRHRANTFGYVKSGGSSSPVQVKAQARSYDISNIHTSPCHDRYSALQTGSGSIDAYTTFASVLPCSGSPNNGWHRYIGYGYHWVGTYFRVTDRQ
jgi:hypothetical protein